MEVDDNDNEDEQTNYSNLSRQALIEKLKELMTNQKGSAPRNDKRSHTLSSGGEDSSSSGDSSSSNSSNLSDGSASNKGGTGG